MNTLVQKKEQAIPLCKKCSQDDSRRVFLCGIGIFCFKCGRSAYSWYEV